MKLFGILILAVFASDKKENEVAEDPKYGEEIESYEKNLILVKIEEDKYAKEDKKSEFIGVSYEKKRSKWEVHRWSKHENKTIYNGGYDNEETAAHASDTLARKLIENGEQKIKLNFPDDYTEVYPPKTNSYSKFIGVTFNVKESKWKAQRWSKHEKKEFHNGWYDDEETAAHASDTLARKLMENGEQNHKLNFPEDDIEVYPEKKQFTSKFIGVFYNKNKSKWAVQRWDKHENKQVSYGYFDDEETAAHASDTLAKQLMENGEQKLKLNLSDDDTQVQREKRNKRKRQKNLSLEHPQNK